MTRAVIAGIIQAVFFTVSLSREMPDVVFGNLQQFNDNGSWSLFQDERAVVDIDKNRLIIGSVACSTGVFGYDRAGNVEAVRCDLETGLIDWFSLRNGNSDLVKFDSRCAPALFIRPDGGYLAMYAKPFDPIRLNYRIFSANFWQDWDEERAFELPIAAGTKTAFSGASLLAARSENRLYNFLHGPNGTIHFSVSENWGDSWIYGGLLLGKVDTLGGTKERFCRFAGNGKDRIDVMVTERLENGGSAGVFHGFIKNGALHNSYGTVVDESIFDTVNAVPTSKLTKIFPDAALFKENEVNTAWGTDIQFFTQDTIAAVVTVGIAGVDKNEAVPAYRIVYCRFDGREWGVHCAAKAGLKRSVALEENYDAAALDPDDGSAIYLSSTFDPRDETPLGVHEIFRGNTADHGRTWNWTPITVRSTRDNLSPVVPAWSVYRRALLWLRGSCVAPYDYDAAIVGIIDRNGEMSGKKKYIDASRRNCINGCCFDSLELTYDKESSGGDNRWHELTGVGNNGTVLVSSEEKMFEDAMLIKMVLELKEPGIYNFWANFWGKPDTASDWLISTALSPAVQLFRQMACRTVDPSEYDDPPLVNMGDSLFLYQAYSGRDTIDSGEVACIFIDDHVLSVQEYFGDGGDVYRTWFDGVSYSRVETPARIEVKATKRAFSVVRPQYVTAGSLVKITGSVTSGGRVETELFDLKGKLIMSHVSWVRSAGTYTATFPAPDLKCGAYICRLKSSDYSANAVLRVVR